MNSEHFNLHFIKTSQVTKFFYHKIQTFVLVKHRSKFENHGKPTAYALNATVHTLRYMHRSMKELAIKTLYMSTLRITFYCALTAA